MPGSVADAVGRHIASGVGPWAGHSMAMSVTTARGREPEPVLQFSVFIPNRMGRMHEVVRRLVEREVHIVALTVLDTTDSTILRIVVDDPDGARRLLEEQLKKFERENLEAAQNAIGQPEKERIGIYSEEEYVAQLQEKGALQFLNQLANRLSASHVRIESIDVNLVRREESSSEDET